MTDRLGDWVAVYQAGELEARLALSFLQGHGLRARMVSDVSSELLGDPAERGVRTRYSRYLVLVTEPESERGQKLMAEFCNSH